MPLETSVTERQLADAQRMEHLETYRVDAYTTVTSVSSRRKYKICCPLCGKMIKEKFYWESDFWHEYYTTCPNCHGGIIVEVNWTVTARAERPLEE
jgi:hypothetical protein